MRAPLISIALVACGPSLPPNIECAAVHDVANDAELSVALGAAVEGECILLAGGDYAGPIVVPPGVSLVGANGEGALLSGGSPAVVQAGDRGRIYNITISSGPAQGILIDAIDFILDYSNVFDVADAAVGIRCEDPGCLRGTIELNQVLIERAESGVVVLGASAAMTEVEISGITTTGLSGGGAIYVANGGRLTVSMSSIADSDYGAVADGPGTELHLRRATAVRDCASAGVWAQNLSGTAAQPALTLEESTVVSGHAGAGVLVLDSSGVSIADAFIGDTALRTTVIGGMNAAIGDGLLLLSSSEVIVRSTELYGNARAAAVVDAAGPNIEFGTNTVDSAGGQWEVVVQNGGIPVTVPAQDLSTAPLLPVPADRIVVPTLGP